MSPPTLLQILNGKKPANTAAIRVDLEPGSKWRYSGGGYTVLQQLIIDVTAQPFPIDMRGAVLEPLRKPFSRRQRLAALNASCTRRSLR